MTDTTEADAMTAALARLIETTGPVEVAARIGRPPAPIGDSDRYTAEWITRLLCIGYGLKTPALTAADIVQLDADAPPRQLDKAEKRIRALAVMICMDTLHWTRARTAQAWGKGETKIRNVVKSGREWASNPKAAEAITVVIGHVVRRISPATLTTDAPPLQFVTPRAKDSADGKPSARRKSRAGAAG